MTYSDVSTAFVHCTPTGVIKLGSASDTTFSYHIHAMNLMLCKHSCMQVCSNHFEDS